MISSSTTGPAPPSVTISPQGDCWIGRFTLMASPCEIHLYAADSIEANRICHLAYTEGLRIERHFSRYIKGNILDKINTSSGTAVALDNEYVELLNYAFSLHEMSDGLFDISTGVLKKLWPFEHGGAGVNQLPSAEVIADVLQTVGLEKILWPTPNTVHNITLPAGMQLDFGGIGKEYAVDKAGQVIEQNFSGNFLVNFGGDCYCKGSAALPWSIGIESVELDAAQACAKNSVTLSHGGGATSGTTKRYIELQGKRYGHILNPKTGRPVANAPLSITVVNDSCLSAGALATIAMLQGSKAEEFLQAQDVLYWCLR